MKIMCLLLLVGLSGVSVWAADAPPPSMIAESLIAEIWTCSYKEGKDVDDLLEARDFMVSQANKAKLTLPPSFLWNLTKGDASIDHVRFSVHRNLGAFGASADAMEASGIGPAVLERFSSVSDCVAGMSMAQMIFLRGVPDGSVFISAAACNYIDGSSQESLTELISHIRNVMEGMGDHAPAFSTALAPFTPGAPGSPDVTLYNGYENATGWSNYVRELFTTEAGQRLRDHQGRVLECGGLTLWSSQQVVGAAAE